MKKLSFKQLLAGALIVASIAGASTALAGGGKHFFRSLDLSSEQKEQVKTLRKQQKEQMKTLYEEMKEVKARRGELLEQHSEEAANNLADDVAAITRKIVLQRIEGQRAIYEVLDDQQKEKFVEHSKEMASKHGKRGRHHRDHEYGSL